MIGKSSVFQIAFFFGCGYISPIADCLTVSEAYGQDNVVFTCVISPYTGRQIWLKDSAEVADCGFVSCFVNASNPAHYHFTHDLSSGNFTFKIESLGTTNEGSIIGCFDGTNTQEITIQKAESSTPSGKRNNKETVFVAVGCSVGGICVIASFFVWKRRKRLKRNAADQPAPNEEFYVINVGQTSVRVRWKLCKDGESPKTYRLTLNDNTLTSLKENVNGNFMEYTISGLEQSTLYDIGLACHDGSDGFWSPQHDGVLKTYLPLKIKTFGQGQFDQDREIHLLNVGQRSIKVCWATIKMRQQKHKYTMTYSENGTQKSLLFETNGKERITHIINDLKPSTSYNLNLTCTNDSHEVIKKFEQLGVETKGCSDDQPAPKEEFYVINVGQTSVRVRWRLCKDGESPKTYRLTLNDNTPTSLKEDVNGNFMEYTISDLNQSTLYDIGLACHDGSDGFWAPHYDGVLKTYGLLKIKTFGKQDGQEIHLLNLGQTSMTVRWKVYRGGAIRKKYALEYFGNGILHTRRFQNKAKNFMRVTITDLTLSTLYTLNLRCSEVSDTYKTIFPKTYGNIADQPAPEEEFCVLNVDQTNIVVRWKLFKEGDSNKKYKLTWNGENGYHVWRDDTKDNFKVYQITGLQKSTLYQLKLICSEEAVASDVSDEDKSDEFVKKYESLDVRTNDPLDDSELFTAGTTGTSLTVQWTEFKDDHVNKYILSYIKDGETYDIPIDADTDDLKHQVNGLQPSTLYELNLRCCDKSYNLLKVYKPLYKRTSGTGVAHEEDFYDLNVDNTSVRVRWKVCKDGKSSNIYYLFCNKKMMKGPLKEGGNKEFMEYPISDLTQSTMYEFTLDCYDAEAEELIKTYGPLNIETFERAETEEFSTLDVTATSIRVRWKICKSGTPEKKYLLSYFENGSTYDKCIYSNVDNLYLEHTFIGLTPSALHELNLRCLDESNKLLKVYKTLYKRTKDSPNDNEFWTSEVAAQTIKVHWKKCTGGPPVKTYVLSYFGDGMTDDQPLDCQKNKCIQEFRLKNLKPSTLYELILRCTDESQKLLKVYKPIYKRTKCMKDAKIDAEETFDYPESAGMDEFYTCTVTQECIEVSWKKYNCKDSSEKKYVLSYFKNGKTIYPTNEEKKSKKKSQKKSKKKSLCSISGLHSSTLYELNLRCLDAENKLLKVYQPLYKRTNAEETAYRVESEKAT